MQSLSHWRTSRLRLSRKGARLVVMWTKTWLGNATWGKLLGHTNHTFNAENRINAGVMAEDDNQVDVN